jgi:hypothetical protein
MAGIIHHWFARDIVPLNPKIIDSICATVPPFPKRETAPVLAVVTKLTPASTFTATRIEGNSGCRDSFF